MWACRSRQRPTDASEAYASVCAALTSGPYGRRPRGAPFPLILIADPGARAFRPIASIELLLSFTANSSRSAAARPGRAIHADCRSGTRIAENQRFVSSSCAVRLCSTQTGGISAVRQTCSLRSNPVRPRSTFLPRKIKDKHFGIAARTQRHVMIIPYLESVARFERRIVDGQRAAYHVYISHAILAEL